MMAPTNVTKWVVYSKVNKNKGNQVDVKDRCSPCPHKHNKSILGCQPKSQPIFMHQEDQYKKGGRIDPFASWLWDFPCIPTYDSICQIIWGLWDPGQHGDSARHC